MSALCHIIVSIIIFFLTFMPHQDPKGMFQYNNTLLGTNVTIVYLINIVYSKANSHTGVMLLPLVETLI